MTRDPNKNYCLLSFRLPANYLELIERLVEAGFGRSKGEVMRRIIEEWVGIFQYDKSWLGESLRKPPEQRIEQGRKALLSQIYKSIWK